MNIAFFVNDIAAEKPGYSTTSLGRAALERGHEVWYISVEDFAYDPDDYVRAWATRLPKKAYRKNETFLADLQGDAAETERITVADLDVLLLRNNPADDAGERPWAQTVGILFGQIAVQQGVLVLNDPNHLAHALNKLHFQLFPEEVRPRTLITRDRDDIRAFVEEEGKAVLKPLSGSGGHNVFLVSPDNLGNLNQIFEAISRDGYVVAQEYLAGATDGDTRMILLNGRPLLCKGKVAALFRKASGGDIRSNIHAGGEAQQAKVTDRMLEIAEIVRPRLLQSGMFLVGLDIAGDRLMEVNVFSPGGMWSMEQFEEVPFSHAVIEALEHKVDVLRRYGRIFSNVQLATM